MKLVKRLLFVSLLGGMVASVNGQTTFVFGSNNGGGQAQFDLDGRSSGSTISGGLTLTATANSGTFNATANNGFGINGAGSGDSTTEFDEDNSTSPFKDSMTFSFDQDVTFIFLELSNFGADEGYLTLNASTIIIDSGNFTFDPGVRLAANTDAILGFTSGTGFALESLTVIPESGTAAVLLGIAVLGLVMLGRRKTVHARSS